MTNYIVSYDLIGDKDYDEIHEYLKSFEKWAKPLESFWLIQTEKTASQIRDEAKDCLDDDDKLVVIEAGAYWATRNISKKVNTWMEDNL